MISGCGTDVVEIARIQRFIEKNDRFKYLVYPVKEIEYCESLSSSFYSFAGRFAAKEASLKALGTGLINNMAFAEIFIENDEYGKPNIILSGAKKDILAENKRIHVSISYKKYATALLS
ncbi:MAG: holo-ACP synthase [Cytophagaceae bacterium]